MRADLEGIEHQDIELETAFIATIPSKNVEKFVDPFKYVESKGGDDVTSAIGESRLSQASLPKIDPEDIEPSYALGPKRPVDTEGGDAGCILRRAKYWPVVNFVRSQFCGRPRNSILHADVASAGNNK